MPTDPTEHPTGQADAWPARGARIAEYDRASHVNIVTVDRLTATQITVTGSHLRYRRGKLTALNDNGAGYILRPLTDPGVVKTRAQDATNRVLAAAECARRAIDDATHGYGPSGYDPAVRLDDAAAAAAYRDLLATLRDQATAALADLDDVDEYPRNPEAVLRQLAATLTGADCADQAAAATGLAVTLRDGILSPAEAAQHLRAMLGPRVAVEAAQAAADRLDAITGGA